MDQYRQNDGVAKFRDYLVSCGLLDEAKIEELNREADRIVKEATEYGDKAPFPQPEDTLKHVYAEDWEG